MLLTKENLKKALVIPGHVTEEAFEKALANTRDDSQMEKSLVENGLITVERLSQAVAQSFNYIHIDLSGQSVSDSVRDIIPEVVAHAQQTIILDETDSHIKVATANPERYDFIALLQKKTGKMAKVYYASPLSIERALQVYSGDLRTKVQDTIAYVRNIAHEERGDDDSKEEGIVKLVNAKQSVPLQG